MSPVLRRRQAVTDVPGRLAAVEEVLRLAGDRLDPALRERGVETLRRAGQRLRLSGEHTVVALAGATGSGKSSLVNALAGTTVSPVGVRRPTTSHAHACVWDPAGATAPLPGAGGAAALPGAGGAAALLDWLGVDRRTVRTPEAAQDRGEPAGADLAGLVLVDLPDFDSVATDHRAEVDRLVAMVDLLVWVVDPQKYADAVLHERYLRPLASHAHVSMVVLNQVDTLSPAAVSQCLAHLRRLLHDDGWAEPRVLGTSAVTGEGLDELRVVLADTVQRRRAAQARIAADLDALVDDLDAVLAAAPGRAGQRRGAAPAGGIGPAERVALVDALAASAGVEVVAAAVERSWRARSIQATGLPWTRWTGRLRPDPLRRLHLDRPSRAARHGRQPEVLAEAVSLTIRSSLPAATPVQRSRVDTAVRTVGDRAAAGLPPVWAESLRRAARSRRDDLADALDQAVVGTDLGVDARPRWWRLLGTLQAVAAGAVVVGVAWLAVVAVVAWLGLPPLPAVEVGPAGNGDAAAVPLPTALLAGGLLVGVLLAALGRLAGRVGGRRRRRRAATRLRARIEQVADELILAPVAEELDVRAATGRALARARR